MVEHQSEIQPESALDVDNCKDTHEVSTPSSQSETLSESFSVHKDTPEGAASENGQSLTADMIKMSSELEEFLQCAACLEKESFDEKMVACALSSLSTSKLVAEAVDGHYLAPVDQDEEVIGHDFLYHFPIKNARKQVYQSIPKERRGELHVAIAHRLWKGEYEEAFVLHHFIRGESFLLQSNYEDFPRIANLCLSEGRKAVRASDFGTAASYLNFGIRLLEKMRACWRDEYQLSLELYRASAEANYCDSKFDQAQTSIDAVIGNARCFSDTLGIQATRIHVLGAQGKREDAVRVGLGVLRKLGEPIPVNPGNANVLVEFIKVQRKTRKKTDESIMRLPMMENEEKIAALQILNLIFSHAISSRTIMVPLIVFRSVQLTLQYGLSVMSSVAFAKYGMVLCNMGYFNEGRRYAKLALALYERFPLPEWLPRVYLGVYAGVYGCFDDIEHTIQPLKYACHVGLETGDIEIALIEGHIFTNNLFTLGKPLPIVHEAFSEVYKETTLRKHLWAKTRFSLFLQFLHNLMERGVSQPTMLIGDHFDSDAYRDLCTSDDTGRHIFHLYKMMLCYVFGDYSLAVQESGLCQRLFKCAPSRGLHFTYMPMFAGLSSVAQLRQTKYKSRRATREARKCIRQLKAHAMRCPSFLSGKLFLLQAELAWLLGKHDLAFFKYTCAISSSSAAGVLFDQALANECAGRFKLACGDKDEASAYFKEAQATYSKWGAHAKAEQLTEEMAKLFS